MLAVLNDHPNRSRMLSINHAVVHVDPGLALFVDLEALVECYETLTTTRRSLLLPNFLHIEGVPSTEDLTELASKNNQINSILQSNDVFSFDTTNARQLGSFPVVELRYFSSEPAYQIAVLLGASEVRFFGVDGGSSYAKILNPETHKNNLRFGQHSFDLQWRQLKRLQERYGTPVVRSPEIGRVFVGATEREEVPFRVLKYSIESNSSVPVDVTSIASTRKAADRKFRMGTNFSLQRFLIPELMERRGKAIYLDSDMLVLGDIVELVNRDLKECAVAVSKDSTSSPHWEYSPKATPGMQLSVMILDCQRLDWKFETIRKEINNKKFSYRQLMTNLCITPSHLVCCDIPTEWNSLDFFDAETTRLLHFTNVPTQPWLNPSSEHFGLWSDWFLRAIKSNYLSIQDVEKAVKNGNVHPGLLEVVRSAGFEVGLRGNGIRVRKLQYLVKNSAYRLLSNARNLIRRNQILLRFQLKSVTERFQNYRSPKKHP